MENIKTALASVGGGFQHVVKMTSYLTNLEINGAEFREVRSSYFPNKAPLPASTLLEISRLTSRNVPPGRARLATRPVPTGSPATANTIEMSDDACFAATASGGGSDA